MFCLWFPAFTYCCITKNSKLLSHGRFQLPYSICLSIDKITRFFEIVFIFRIMVVLYQLCLVIKKNNNTLITLRMKFFKTKLVVYVNNSHDNYKHLKSKRLSTLFFLFASPCYYSQKKNLTHTVSSRHSVLEIHDHYY